MDNWLPYFLITSSKSLAISVMSRYKWDKCVFNIICCGPQSWPSSSGVAGSEAIGKDEESLHHLIMAASLYSEPGRVKNSSSFHCSVSNVGRSFSSFFQHSNMMS